MKLALLSNVTCDIIKSLFIEIEEIYTSPGYGSWFEDSIRENSDLNNFLPDVIFILLDANAMLENCNDQVSRISVLEEELSKIKQLISNHKASIIMLSTIDIRHREIRPLAYLNEERELEWLWCQGLGVICDEFSNCLILDLKGIVEEMGRESFYSLKMWYLGGIPYSLSASKRIVSEALVLIKAYSGKRKKCLAIDLDNTIWGGVIGEDGVDGIILGESKEGARYRDIQKRIYELKKLGVLLIVLSKNNRDDALIAFTNNQYMVLKESDFVAIIANWNTKAENLKSVARALNIGSDSFVFLDDNPAEQEEMKAIVPEVETITINNNCFYCENSIQKIFKEFFPIIKLTEEDNRRTESYSSDTKRIELKSVSYSLKDYIQKLCIEIRFRKAMEKDIDRIAQLTQKTNQFNLTTRRYTAEEIRKMMSRNNVFIFISQSKDKFGDNGIIWVSIIFLESTTANINVALMSCRVMGRMIEDTIMACIENYLFKKGIKYIKGEFIPTAKNSPSGEFYQKMGFDMIATENDGRRTFGKSLSGIVPMPDYHKVIEE